MKAKQAANMKNKKGRAIGEHAHVAQLKQGPLPAAGLAPNNGDRAHALEGKHKKDHQADAN